MKIARMSPCLALLAAFAVQAKDPQADKPPQLTAEQQAMMQAYEKAALPGEPHKQLAGMVGQWTTQQTVWWDPDTPPVKQQGSVTNTMELGGRHVRQEYSSQWMGKPFQGVGYTGYDNVTGQYYSAWMDSASTGLFVSYGSYDPASRTYTFKGQMADPARQGAMVPMRQTVRVTDHDHHVMDMFETRDGKEVKVMQIEYARTK